MQSIIAAPLKALTAVQRQGMFRLRYQTFKERLNWKVSGDGGLERDEFDHEGTVYILVDTDGAIEGCWRLLPTTGAYMLRDTFPELLHGQLPPCDEQVWELSRFAVASRRTGATSAAFGPLTMDLMRESVRYAMENDIRAYVTVSSVAVERLLLRQGIHLERLGPPILIGTVHTVAFHIPIDDITRRALGLPETVLYRERSLEEPYVASANESCEPQPMGLQSV